ncbi:pseudouridine synthase [Spiroplasma endosymbiont of Labia minor]|uniref:pseudouridine synthase n=1 Tax=Spiroplasma endosymbiont of Labia minor TaxID=3066305 RepID=UPI0030D53D16
MQERLQKIIAARGYTSRRKAEELILAGRVKVNGIVINKLGEKINDDAKIEINNRELIKSEKKYYFLFNKPRLVLTTLKDPKQRPTVADYFKNEKVRLFPVGRLDYDVSGALLMTNDGEFANFVMHPKYEIQKTYLALCNGNVSKHQINNLMKGVVIDDDYKTKAINAKLVKYNVEDDESIIELTIAEGRKHHVKKMLIAADIYLKKLKRTTIEHLQIADVPLGKYRSLTAHEVKQLYGLFAQYKSKK